MTVTVGQVGFGYWGSNLARNIDAVAGLDLVAIADSSPERRRDAQSRHQNAVVTADMRSILESPEIDAVALATPATSHGQLALDALRAGKHVFVEKPLAMSEMEASAIVDASTETGLVAMVGHTFLYSSPVRALKKMIDSGHLGDIKYLYSQRLNLGRIRQDCDALWNFAPHDISIVLYLLGEHPSEASARGVSFIQSGIKDVYFATLIFPSGATFNLHVSWIDPRKVRSMTVVGNERMVVYDDVSADRKIEVYDSAVAGPEGGSFGSFASFGDFQWRTRAGQILTPRIAIREPLTVEMEEFAEAIQQGRRPLTDARHGRQVVRILEAIQRSSEISGQSVHIAEESEA